MTPPFPENDDPNDDLKNFWSNATENPTNPKVAPPPTVRRVDAPQLLESAPPPVKQNFAPSEVRTISGANDQSGKNINELLSTLLDMGSSDLHLTAGEPPMTRKNGDIGPIPGQQVLSSDNIRALLFSIMPEEKQATYLRTHELDFAYELPGRSRFRINVMQQRGNVGSVIRVIPNEIKSLKQLGMPDTISDFSKLPRGLVLVTGPTGSGKSTTLAAIIDAANQSRKDHILTIEDPIEFVHENKNCIVNQREIGGDTDNFPEALKRALRQDPDIILIGEMRDVETISIAITAAETGHLVFGTLHTQSVAETMSRIIDSFPDGSKDQIRSQLAATIQGIVCQTLVKTLDGRGRVAAMEILKGEPAIRALIRKGGEQQIQSALETGRRKGMQTLNMSLMELARENKIDVDEAANRSTSPEIFYNQLGGSEAVDKIRRVQKSLGFKKV